MYQYFDLDEFDSPDLPGSGELMDPEFVALLDKARGYAQTAFFITSGYRTKEHHADLGRRGYKTAKDSPHVIGKAADIRCSNSRKRFEIINALLLVGFTRIGVAKSFIHVDIDTRTHKSQEVIWVY